MADPSKHTYSKDQIRAILARASQLEATKEEDSEGLTEEELLSIADEVGLSRNSIREALKQIERGDDVSDEQYDWVSGTSSIQHIFHIPDSIDSSRWDTILLKIRKETGGIGSVKEQNGRFEWEQRRREFGYRHISVSQKQDFAQVRIISNWSGYKFMLTSIPILISLMLVLMITKAMDVGSMTQLISIFIAGAGAFTLGRWQLKRYFYREKDRLRSIMSTIRKQIRGQEKKDQLSKSKSKDEHPIIVPEKEPMESEDNKSSYPHKTQKLR